MAVAFQAPPEIKRPASWESPCSSSKRASRLGERCEDGMLADPAKPVGGVAGVGLAAMGDAVPVGRERAFAQVVGLLGGVVAGVPEVVDLEQTGGEAEPRAVRRAGKDRDPGRLATASEAAPACAAWPGPAAGPARRRRPARPARGRRPGRRRSARPAPISLTGESLPARRSDDLGHRGSARAQAGLAHPRVDHAVDPRSSSHGDWPLRSEVSP